MDDSFLAESIVAETCSRADSDSDGVLGSGIRKNAGIAPEADLYEPFRYNGRYGFTLPEDGLFALGDSRGVSSSLRKRRILGFASTARPVAGEVPKGLLSLRLQQPEITVIRQICPSVRAWQAGEYLGFNQYYGDLPDDVLDTLIRAVEVGLFDQLQIWQEREFSTLSALRNRVLVVGIRKGVTYLLAGWGGDAPEALSVAGFAKEVLDRCEIAMKYLVTTEVREEKAPAPFEFLAILLIGIVPASVLVLLGWMPLSFDTFDNLAFSVSAGVFWCTAFGVFGGVLIAWVSPGFWSKCTAIKLDPAWRWVRDTWNRRRNTNLDAKAVARLMGTGNWRDISRLAETARGVLTSCCRWRREPAQRWRTGVPGAERSGVPG